MPARSPARAPASRRRTPRRPLHPAPSALVALPAPPEVPPAPRPGALAALIALPVALLVAGIVLLAFGIVAGAAAAALGVVVLAGDVALGAPSRIARRLGGRPADPVREARLVNVVEGLCAAAGVAVPELRILEDPAANALVVATRREALLYCTSGLLTALDRMGLEAVLAHELSHLKRGEAASAGLASLACGALLAWLPASARLVAYLSGDQREALADLAGVRLTRYPPALASAIETLGSTVVRPTGLDTVVLRATAGWWFAPLAEAEPARTIAGRLDLGLRATALAEL